MPKVVGLRFRTSPKMYWFAPVGDDEQYGKGAAVIVETQRGTEIATVVMPPKEVDEREIVAPLKEVLRLATEDEVKAVVIDDEQKRGILATAKQKVAERGLDMKIVDCEYTVDHGKLVLYFTAEQRVDFRELVRDLASAFHMRIDLRQISARDECKLIGALGSCGMPCCCGGFESDGQHVSIKMAKNQSLALTPNKINGMCGRLLCCLGYENKTYEDVLKRAPKHGSFVTAPDGRRGSVVSVTPLTEIVKVRFGNDENFEFAEFPMSELTYERRVEEEKPEGDGKNKDGGKGDKKNKKQNNNNNNNNNGQNANGGQKNGKRFDKKKKDRSKGVEPPANKQQ
ncbi:MAG: stage 0 sporulation protein [Clostridiales bacterium]|nr:stage 0 sporulation protein [Clostridiales bacterium]